MINKTNKVKMKDVAERAGVSVMTVSLALRNDQSSNRLSASTRQRILDVAHELNYSPNAGARAMRLGITNVIGLYAGYGFVNVRWPFFTEVVAGLQDGCEEFGKDLLLHGTFRNRSTNEVFRELRDGRIDGLIVNVPSNDPLAALLLEAHLPVIAIADPMPGIPSVVVDDVGGARLMAEHLAARGHKKCLYVNSGLAATSSQRRWQGFQSSAAKLGLKVEEYVPVAPRPTTGVMQNWLERDPSDRPDAIVCWNDPSAYDVLGQCRHHGISVPDDVAVTGFDGCPTPYDGFWELSTLRAPWAKAAKLAVEYVDKLICGEKVPAETILPVELITGRTS